jgi:hypothetical protein
MSNTDELNEKTTLDFSEYSYVCASTLNQMVNYIPLVMDEFKFKDFYTVTLYRDINLSVKVKENQKWDENLQETLDKNIITFNEIKIEQNEFLKVSKTTQAFDNALKNKKIFWNLTGGQRPFVLAVLEYVKDKPEHYVAYLEGNTGQMSVKLAQEEILIPYSLPKGTKIETALKLMGFKVSIDGKGRTISFEKLVKHDDRKQFVLTNKDETKDSAKNEIKKILEGILTGSQYSTFCKEYLDISKPYPFGDILEYMTVFSVLKYAKPYILDISFSASTQFLDSDIQKSTRRASLDEFDVIILTKKGKIVVFECKSGDMKGDVSKSTKFSTYSVAGVYGKPILITPLIESELKDFEDKKLNRLELESIKSAIRSAITADLDYYGIDKLSKNDVIKGLFE